MFLLKFPVECETWSYVVALGLSVIFGARGVVFQLHLVKDENRKRKEEGKVEWSPWEQIIVQCFHDCIYNVVGSLAGWAALYMLSYRLFMDKGFVSNQPNLSNLGWTDLWLAVFALLGITAKLPETIRGFIDSIAKSVETITGKLSKS